MQIEAAVDTDAKGRARRADAQRSVDAIVDAVIDLVGRGDRLTMAAVARSAGVARITLYAHFPTLEAVVEAAAERAIADARSAVDTLGVDSAQDPGGALAELVASHWESLATFRNLYAVASGLLEPEQLRALHDPLFGPVADLIGTGQYAGEFRGDLPQSWLVASVYGLMHQAADEVAAGRLSFDDARLVLTESVLALVATRPAR